MVCENSRRGRTSICADILNGRRTEVDSISGAVLDAAHHAGIPVPCHEMAVRLIHALEKKNGYTAQQTKGEMKDERLQAGAPAGSGSDEAP